MTPPRIVTGFPADATDDVAQLFWEAFSQKLSRLMQPQDRALAYLRLALRPEFAFSALDASGQVIGVVGIKTDRGGLVSGGFAELAQAYGTFGALWRGPLLDLLERPLAEGQLLLDGVFVSSAARGQGVGTLLLDRVIAEAQARGCSEVQLDVIDTNPRAAALYQRLGFEVTAVRRMGLLRLLFGFSRYTRMVYRLPPSARPT